MLITQALTLPDSRPQAAPSASLAFQLPLSPSSSSSAARATRVGGHRGIGQSLRGAWRPAFLEPAGVAPNSASADVVAASPAKAPPVPLRWWQNLLQRLGMVDFDPAIAPSHPLPEQPKENVAAATDFAAAEVFHLPTAPDADPAASFWDEIRLSPGESVQVYAPAEAGLAITERSRIGRSFLGAYRKGRRAADGGLQAKHCPYQPKQEIEGRPVNALTRTFQRYWTEGLHDALAGQPERYV